MTTWFTDFQNLMDEAMSLSNETEQCRILERAIDLADTNNDIDAGYDARLFFIDAATFAGKSDAAFTAFVWCLTRLDEDPDRNAQEEENARGGGGLFWAYKWVSENAACFLAFERQQLMSLIDDMKERYERIGIGRKSLHGVAGENYWALGEDDLSFRENDLEQDADEDEISDCHACVVNRRVDSLVRRGRDADAIKHARPILERKLSCKTVPACTYAVLLQAYFRTGKREPGMTALRALLPKLGKSAKDLTNAALAANFLTLTGNFAKAASVLQRHLEFLTPENPGYDDLLIFEALTLLVMRLDDMGKKTITLRFPPAQRAFTQVRWNIPELRRLAEATSADLAQRFDARNGNRRVSERRAALLAQREQAVDWPLTPTSSS